METNDITCPKCGHLNNYISEGCVRCGIIFSKYKSVRETGKELADAGTPGDENKFQVSLEPKPGTDTEPTKLEIEMIEKEDRPKADASTDEPESVVEADPNLEENQFETVTAISKEKIGIPRKAETASAAIEIPMGPETSGKPEAKSSTSTVPDQQAESLTATGTVFVESEIQKTSPPAVPEKEKQETPEIPVEQNEVSAMGENTLEEEEVIELTEPLEKEQEILLEDVADPVEADPVETEAAPAGSEDEALTELLKKQKAAQSRAEALNRQSAQSAKSEIIKKSEDFQLKTQALKQQKEAQIEAETLVQETQTSDKGTPSLQQQVQVKSLEPRFKIMRLLKKYEGKTIGINYDNSAEIKEAELVEANDEFFSVMVKDKKLQYSYPLQTLLSLIEGEDGVKTEEAEPRAKFDAVIKIYPLVLF